jgi:hypothetical protein
MRSLCFVLLIVSRSISFPGAFEIGNAPRDDLPHCIGLDSVFTPGDLCASPGAKHIGFRFGINYNVDVNARTLAYTVSANGPAPTLTKSALGLRVKEDGVPTVDILRHVFAIAIPIPMAMVVAYFFRPRTPRRPAFYSNWEHVEQLTDAAALLNARAFFFECVKLYHERSRSLHRNTYYWVLLSGLTILVLVRTLGKEFQMLGVAVPGAATHAAVTAAMLYLWIEFGATLKFLTFERMALWKLIDAIEGPAAHGVVPVTSLRPVLHGSVFVDAWFSRFLPQYTDSQTRRSRLRAGTLRSQQRSRRLVDISP